MFLAHSNVISGIPAFPVHSGTGRLLDGGIVVSYSDSLAAKRRRPGSQIHAARGSDSARTVETGPLSCLQEYPG